MSEAFKPLLGRLAAGEILTAQEMRAFFGACLRGEPTPAQIAAAVTAMKMRGETVEEIAACVEAMREAAAPFDPGFEVIDTCGTGGDGRHTFNISTAAAFIAAGAGARVAKHGSRALSSRSGSSDVLGALGVNIMAGADQSRRALEKAGVCFLFAPAWHAAFRHVTPIRAELGFRTLFNVLGPMANPAGARRQIMGVYDPRLIEPLAEVLGRLGARHAWVVHGEGLDELTLSGDSDVAEWREGALARRKVSPRSLGLARVEINDLKGGEPMDNARALLALLDGTAGAYREVAVLNAAAALLVAGLANDLETGLGLARESIDSGRARRSLELLVEASNA